MDSLKHRHFLKSFWFDVNVSHFDYSISIFIRNDKPKYLKIISVAMNCGARSMGDTAVNYPFTLFWSSAISWDQYSQSRLIAERKSQLIFLSGLSLCAARPAGPAHQHFYIGGLGQLWHLVSSGVQQKPMPTAERMFTITTMSHHCPL